MRHYNRKEIVPDRVSPAIEGYFRIPAVWIGEVPDPAVVMTLNPSVHHAIVFQKKLQCGIEVRVQRDGMFLFDFSTWPLAPITVIPGYKIPDPNFPYREPLEHKREAEKAENIAVFRAQVMNAHQACLTTSERVVRHRGATMGFPVNAWNTYKLISFNASIPYYDDSENLHALGRNVLNNSYRVNQKQPIGRRVLELDVVEHSFNLLDSILLQNNPAIIQLVEAAYMSACRSQEKRFGECVVLGWGVCEQLISIAWNRMLKNAKSSDSSLNRIPKSRYDKLTGRDYTASVMVEMLELSGKIDHELYRLLEITRKARNDWAHKMKTPADRVVSCCQEAMQRLLRDVLGIHLLLQPGGRGGVPQWPIWTWEKVRAQSR